jgi:hypothetical protein
LQRPERLEVALALIPALVALAALAEADVVERAVSLERRSEVGSLMLMIVWWDCASS